MFSSFLVAFQTRAVCFVPFKAVLLVKSTSTSMPLISGKCPNLIQQFRSLNKQILIRGVEATNKRINSTDSKFYWGARWCPWITMLKCWWTSSWLTRAISSVSIHSRKGPCNSETYQTSKSSVWTFKNIEYTIMYIRRSTIVHTILFEHTITLIYTGILSCTWYTLSRLLIYRAAILINP